MNKPSFAVLFDIDGVLIDSHAASLHSQKLMGEKFHFTPQEVQTSSKRGGSLRDFYTALQKLRPFDTDFDTFADTMLAANFTYLEKHVQGPDPQLLVFLQDLRAHHVPVAVGTSALKRSAARKLALVKLHKEFDVLVTADDVDLHKPHPDVYLEAARRVGVNPTKCIVIEDAAAGVTAGKTAGMKVVGLSKYVKDVRTLKGADLVVADFSDLSVPKLMHLVNG